MLLPPPPQAVGASGAIFGMVGAWGAFWVMNQAVLGRDQSQRVLKGIGQTIMINVVYGMSISQVDNMGHLGVSPLYVLLHFLELYCRLWSVVCARIGKVPADACVVYWYFTTWIGRQQSKGFMIVWLVIFVSAISSGQSQLFSIREPFAPY